MKEKITDRRIQRTRQLLLDALSALILEKGYEAMTVQDVIDYANVGRSTFYTHFQDKEDLLLNGIESLWDDLEAHLKAAIPSEEMIWAVTLSMFQHAQDNRSLYKALVGKQGGTIALKHIQKQLYLLIYEHMQFAASQKKNEIPVEILANHIVSSFLALLTWWLDNNANYSAEQINGFYQQLLKGSVDLFVHANGR
jgi:AcrR family transcriptional regulator